LSAAQVETLSPAQVAALTSVQLAAMDAEDIATFSTADIAAIASKAIAGLTTDAVAGLSAEQTAALGTSAIARPDKPAGPGAWHRPDRHSLRSAGQGADLDADRSIGRKRRRSIGSPDRSASARRP
jgi:hypothetical protein